MTAPARSGDRRPGDRERGAALVEMSVVVGLLALFLFGIITFGVTLSFDQSLTQAANEAGRAAAVAPRDQAVVRAQAAADRTVGAWGSSCDGSDPALACSFVIDPCADGSALECMTVELRYDLAGHPRVPTIGVVASLLPDDLVARVVVEVNAVAP